MPLPWSPATDGMDWVETATVATAVTTAALKIPTDWARYTDHQMAFLQDDAGVVLTRGGNQIGKTYGVHLDCVHTARGTHPFQRTPKPPVNILVMSESWGQMGMAGGFMDKLWQLLPKGEIDPKTRYEPGRGITGKPPRIHFVRGPGKGSVISFGTYRQGAAPVAGATLHRVYLDEPPDARLQAEIMPRVLRHGGKVRIVFTPTADMPNMDWLREAVEKGHVSEHNPHLCEASCWPRGAPYPWLTEAKIEAIVNGIPERYRGMRVRGDWTPVYTNQLLDHYVPAIHDSDDRLPPAGAWVGVGIDHGIQPGKQAAVLVAVSGRFTEYPHVWILDEHKADGLTTPEQDAIAILQMLERWSIGVADVDSWVGDRSTQSLTNRYIPKKMNKELRKWLAFHSKIRLSHFPDIVQPRKWHGSVDHGMTLINTIMSRGKAVEDGEVPHMTIRKSCVNFRKFCQEFDGRPGHATKDIGDAGRYAIERAFIDQPVPLIRPLY